MTKDQLERLGAAFYEQHGVQMARMGDGTTYKRVGRFFVKIGKKDVIRFRKG